MMRPQIQGLHHVGPGDWGFVQFCCIANHRSVTSIYAASVLSKENSVELYNLKSCIVVAGVHITGRAIITNQAL